MERRNKGITLIALVITIIVLLILAGISIAMLVGNNGILTKAESSKEETHKADVIENAKIDVLEIQAEKEGTITKAQLKNILEKYFKEVPQEELPDDLSTLTLLTKEEYGNYEINIADIYNGKLFVEDLEESIKELVLFDYQNGGMQYDTKPYPEGLQVLQEVNEECITGKTTDKLASGAGCITVEAFDLSPYNYLYFEGYFPRKYGFSELQIFGFGGFNSVTGNIPLPMASEYTSYYIDITGHQGDTRQLYTRIKMSGDYLRYAKFTNQKPEGTYFKSMSE